MPQNKLVPSKVEEDATPRVPAGVYPIIASVCAVVAFVVIVSSTDKKDDNFSSSLLGGVKALEDTIKELYQVPIK